LPAGIVASTIWPVTTKNTYTNLTAGEIVDVLSKVPPDTEIHIEEHVFYRWKWRGEKLLALELSTLDEIESFNTASE
jgi:hypothetical protein